MSCSDDCCSVVREVLHGRRAIVAAAPEGRACDACGLCPPCGFVRGQRSLGQQKIAIGDTRNLVRDTVHLNCPGRDYRLCAGSPAMDAEPDAGFPHDNGVSE